MCLVWGMKGGKEGRRRADVVMGGGVKVFVEGCSSVYRGVLVVM